jgi:transposase
VLVETDSDGEVVDQRRIANDPKLVAEAVASILERDEVDDVHVVLEATYGWYWAADVLAASGANVHLAHPLGVAAFSNRRVKNDWLDAKLLADLLRTGTLAEAWIAPDEVRELRELVRFRHKLVGLRTNLKDQVHAVLAKHGVAVAMTDLFGKAGREFLDELVFPEGYQHRIRSCLRLIDTIDRQLTQINQAIVRRVRHDPGWQAIQAIPGVGPVLAAVFVAEIGDVTRFDRPAQLCSWVGLTPRHRESDRKVARGPITKQGSRLARWAAVEAAQRLPSGSKFASDFERIAARRGRKIARVAIARQIVTYVYYGLRDGHVRAFAPTP